MIEINKYYSKLTEKTYTVKERIQKSKETAIKILRSLPRQKNNSILLIKLDKEYEQARFNDKSLLPIIGLKIYKFSKTIEFQFVLPNSKYETTLISSGLWQQRDDNNSIPLI